MERVHPARCVGGGTEPPHPLQEHHPPGTSPCSLTWNLFNPFSFRLSGGFITQIPQLAMGDGSPASLPKRRGGGMGLKAPTL